jgi:hypothetical protein
MKTLWWALAAALAMTGTAGADPVEDILARAAEDCRAFNAGEFAANDAVVEVDLDGDGPDDALVDESRYTCSSAASMYCGSGGCMLHAVAGGTTSVFQAEGWKIVDWDGRPVLLVARDGGWCGGAGAQLCFEAVAWSDGRMLTVMPEMNR